MDLSSNCFSRSVSSAQGTQGTLRLHHHSPSTVAYPGVIQHSHGATVTPRRLPCFPVVEDTSVHSYRGASTQPNRDFYKQPELHSLDSLNSQKGIKQETPNNHVSRLTSHEQFASNNQVNRNYANVLNGSNVPTSPEDSKALTEADDKREVAACRVVHRNDDDVHGPFETRSPVDKTEQETTAKKIETGKLPTNACQNGHGVQTIADGKPSLSYIGLIAKSIIESPQSRLSLGSIYRWIENNFPYYKNRGQGWRNSVRHNLSLNDCFIKAGRCEDGKGNYWAIHPANLQDFLGGDFRQRRRCRRRGRKKEVDYSLYQITPHLNHCSYIPANTASVSTGIPFNPSPTINSFYSPYTEAERQAYRLDEALLRQSMNNPFVKFYNGLDNHYHSGGQNSTLYPPSLHHWQGYPETAGMYHQFTGFTSPR